MENIGGQAVIEGVMMRNKSKVATAVRLPNGKIKIKRDKVKKRSKFWKIPFFRGMIALWDMLNLGIKTLLWSADQQLDEHEKITKKDIALMLILTIGLVLVIFIGIPYFLTFLTGVYEERSPVLFNLIDGVIKIAIFFGYLTVISFVKDVKVLFQYHGAEHKAVNCYEAKKKLEHKNIKKFSTQHPRCGTSFIIIVLIIGVFLFSFLPLLVLKIFPNFIDLGFWSKRGILFPLRILIFPLVASISYELLRFSARFEKNFIMRIFIIPGLMVQKITTKEPNKKQVEVAVKALKAVLKS